MTPVFCMIFQNLIFNFYIIQNRKYLSEFIFIEIAIIQNRVRNIEFDQDENDM